MSQDKKSDGDFLEGVVAILRHFAICYYHFLQICLKLSAYFWLNFTLGLGLCLIWAYRGTYLYLLSGVLPQIVTPFIIHWVMRCKPFNHFLWLGGIYIATTFYLVGLRRYSRIRRTERAFMKVGIRNNLGEYPKVVDYHEVSEGRFRARLVIDGIDTDEFNAKSNPLKSSLGATVEEVRRHEDPRILDLYLTKKFIPKKILYREISSALTKPYTFIVGKPTGDLITQDISDLPHMLVAGTTGSGKSVFIEQVLMGLLEGSASLQVYLIDLKNGLELRDFTLCPNVVMVKKISDSLLLLSQIKAEMDRRFGIFEKNGYKKIDPARDKLDRIVVCIDEASVLYATGRVNPTDKENAKTASEVTDAIAKLSRAAGIHLVLATQKVTKESLSTHIQENLEGRMCFEVNSVQGSNMVIGNASAKDLPHIPGAEFGKSDPDYLRFRRPILGKRK